MTTMMKKSVTVLTEIWFPAALFAAWWLLSANSPSLYFPPLSKIVAQLGDVLSTRLTSDILPSLQNFGMGLGIAVLSGILLGLILGTMQRVYDAVKPLLEFMRAIPGVAILPMALLLFGIGPSMKVAVIVFGAFWPVLLNTIDGIRGIDSLVREVARSYAIKPTDYIRRILLPAASPQIISGVRISVSLSVILIVASEYIASTEGIGFIQLQSARLFQMDVMWAALLLLGVLGYFANVLFRFVEHRLLRWHSGVRGTAQGA